MEQNRTEPVFSEFWDVLEGIIIRKHTVFNRKTMFFEFKLGSEINGFMEPKRGGRSNGPRPYLRFIQGFSLILKLEGPIGNTFLGYLKVIII